MSCTVAQLQRVVRPFAREGDVAARAAGRTGREGQVDEVGEDGEANVRERRAQFVQ